MKSLVVISPYVPGGDGKAVLPNKAMLPVGPLVVAGQLQERGHEVEVLDLVFEEEWRQALPASVPDVLLLSCHTMRNIPCCTAVLGELSHIWGKKLRTVLGGNIAFDIGISDLARLGRLEVDAVIRGFAHGADVLQAIENGMKGDIYPDKKMITGNLPAPALDLLSSAAHAQYLRASGGQFPLDSFGLGCQWNCAYCSSKGKLGWIPRSNLVAEQISKAKQLGYSEIWCVDNLLFTDLAATFEFNRMVSEQGMRWSGMTRAELVCKLPEGFLGQLTSLREVAMGVESVSPSLFSILRRGQTQDYRHILSEAFARVNAAGITSNAFVILDLPGMTDKDFWALCDFLSQIHPGTISWSFYNPPAQQVVEGKFQPVDTGFYRWPLGFSAVSPERVVQWAMILSGRWWCGWTPKSQFFWQEDEEFGVDFLECRLLQERTARSPVGDLWEIWKERRTS